jgi:hypothetical protein
MKDTDHNKEPVFICEGCNKICNVEEKLIEDSDGYIANRSSCCSALAYTVQEDEDA